MVGEIRDSDTAEIALRAAITGHRVLSTLHTNDAVSSANRLLDMGVQPFMLAAALRGVVAQRLLRRVCPQCDRPRPANDDEIAWLRRAGEADPASLMIHEGDGCPFCEHSGYSGRVGLFELVEVDEGMREALRRSNISEFTQRAGQSPTYRPIQDMALDFIRRGTTNVMEVIRVFGEVAGEEN